MSGYAYIEGKYKLQYNSDGTNPRLFDLEADPSTERDIKHVNWEIVRRLKDHLEDNAFQGFLESIAQLPGCEDAGYTYQSYSEKVCPVGSDIFLRELLWSMKVVSQDSLSRL